MTPLRTLAPRVAAAALAFGLVILVAWWYLRDARVDMDVRDFGTDVFLVKSPSELADVSAVYCEDKWACKQAVQSNKVLIARFSDQAEARRVSANSPSQTFVFDWFLVEYRQSDISRAQRAYVQSAIEGLGTSSAD